VTHPGAAHEEASEPHVLVVEDDGETRRLLVRLLRENGLRATGAADGDEMHQALAAATPQLLVLDLMLPRVSGLDLLRELRRDERWAALPIVIVTARGEVGDRTRGLELGADDYVPKPFDRRELLARIGAVLRRTGGAGPACQGRQDTLRGMAARHGAACADLAARGDGGPVRRGVRPADGVPRQPEAGAVARAVAGTRAQPCFHHRD